MPEISGKPYLEFPPWYYNAIACSVHGRSITFKPLRPMN